MGLKPASSFIVANAQKGLAPAIPQEKVVDALLQQVASGQMAPWPFAGDDVACAQVMHRITYHGVAVQVHEQPDLIADWPQGLRRLLGPAVLLQRIWEESHREVLRQLLDEFDDNGVEVLVMKGTALAYSAYTDPAGRRRTDTDLLVKKDHLAIARAILARQDYERAREARICQETWQGETDDGLPQVIDLHWDVINAPALNRAFDLAETFSRAVPLPRLHPAARATDPVTTFLHGCINQLLHRHHGFYVQAEKLAGEVRLIWHLDNTLLASAFTRDDWDDLAARSVDRGLAATCLEALEGMMQIYATPVPADVLDRLRQAAPDDWIGSYVEGRDPLSGFLADWRACPDYSSRLGLLNARLFPGQDPMRERFPTLQGWPMPAQHVLRLVLAPFRLLRRRLSR